MNHIVNDQGVLVVSVGAPGSVEHVKVKYPALVERMARSQWGEAYRMANATEEGIGVDSLMEAAGFHSSVCDVCDGVGYTGMYEDRIPCWQCSAVDE